MRTIEFSLDPASIDRAIRELNEYCDGLEQKNQEFRKEVANRVFESAKVGFESALHADIVRTPATLKVARGSPEPNDTKVSISHDENESVITANGKEAVFIEFGAGITHNGSAGSSPHPWGKDLGFIIGEYGKGHGAHHTWGYYNPSDMRDADHLVITRGTPAAKPLFIGSEEVKTQLNEIGLEVFG